MILAIKHPLKAAFLGALALTALSGVSVAAPSATAQGMVTLHANMVDTVQYRGPDRADRRQDLRYERRMHGERHRMRRQGYTHYYQGYYYATPWWMGGPPAVVVRERPRRPNYARRHVEWCYKHHRTYDPRSNTYIGRDGRPRECVVR
jgi:hypothetical protein